MDQRYEMGGGIILAKYGTKLTGRGRHLKEKVNKVPFDVENFNPDSGIWNLCSQYCSRYNTDFVNEEDVRTLERIQRQSNISLRKLFSNFRLGMLMGIFLETEKINASGTLETASGPMNFNYSFAPTQKVRWELRPTLDLRPSDTWSLRLRPYFKLPLPWEWQNTVTYNNVMMYNVYYDNAPQRIYVPDPSTGAPLLFSANKKHSLFSFNFRVEF
ncbi:MAG: hypothetical protein IPN29_16735 [Saprospiraceae bacterium]|nr:hypothetical protein [Saprospiraceae bacterium]